MKAYKFVTDVTGDLESHTNAGSYGLAGLTHSHISVFAQINVQNL